MTTPAPDEAELHRLLEELYEKGGNPEWLGWGCGCQWNHVHGWEYRCRGDYCRVPETK